MFNNKIVVVTGGGRGIGFGIANRFAQDGATVILAQRDVASGVEAANQLCNHGFKASYERLDVTDPGQCQCLVDKIVKQYNYLDIWINNAGIAIKAPAEDLTISSWQRSIAVNLSGVFYCCQAAGRQMLSQGRGVIINISSTGGFKYIENRTAYAVSKAGVIMLTRALGIEWAKRGVRVVGIAPGVVMTEMVIQGLESGSASMDAYINRTPLHRLGSIEEIAEVTAFLASDKASFITSETLIADGGWVAYQGL